MSTASQPDIPLITGSVRRWKAALTFDATLTRVRELSENCTLRPSPFTLRFTDPAAPADTAGTENIYP